MKRIGKFCGGLLLGLGVLAPAARAQSVETPNVKITLDWAFQGPQSIFLYGDQQGEFKKEGLTVQIDRGSGSGDTITRVGSGAYQFGWADIATMIKFNAENPGQALIAVYVTGDNSPLAAITVDGRGIKTPKDLEGKTLDATAGSSALALFDSFAHAAGFDPKKVTFKLVSGALREPMMVRGDVAGEVGFTTSSVFSIVDLGVPLSKVVSFKYNDYGVKQLGTAIMVRPDFAAKNPKTVAAAIRAINNALKDAIVDPKASVAAIKARDALVNLDTECLRLVDGLETLTLTPRFKEQGISSIDPKRLDDSITETYAAFDMKGSMAADKVYTTAYLPPQADRVPPALGSCK